MFGRFAEQSPLTQPPSIFHKPTCSIANILAVHRTHSLSFRYFFFAVALFHNAACTLQPHEDLPHTEFVLLQQSEASSPDGFCNLQPHEGIFPRLPEAMRGCTLPTNCFGALRYCMYLFLIAFARFALVFHFDILFCSTGFVLAVHVCALFFMFLVSRCNEERNNAQTCSNVGSSTDVRNKA